MKALKNDSIVYTQSIISAINDCYEKNSELSNAELLTLYSFIGQSICEQGEKAFVVHLAQALAEQLPEIKGFSPRNLRRMRDFYRSYECQPELMQKALSLSWTQNAVILDACEANEQRAFYMALATEKNLSKLALMKAIEADTFGATLSDETVQDTVAAVCPAVGDCTAEQGVDTTLTTEQPCGAFATACEPLRQGSSAPDCGIRCKAGFSSDTLGKSPEPTNLKKQQKRSPCPTPKRSAELLPFGINILYKACWRWQLFADYPLGQSPPWWRYYFETTEQRLAFA